MPAFFALTGHDISPFLPWVGLAVAIFSVYSSWSACHRRRLIDNLPTSKVQGVFIGLVELKGTVQAEQPLTSYLSETPCVHYSFEIEERWSRLVTVVVDDDNGNKHTETQEESGWTTVAAETESTPFYLEDDTGHLLIRPDGARIEAQTVFAETCSPFDPLYYGKGPAGGIIDTDGVRRFSEIALPLQVPLFVIGQAREREDIVAPEIAADPRAPEFLLSVRSQEEISGGLGWQIWLFFFLGLLLAPGGHLLADLTSGDREITPLSILIYFGEAALYLAVWATGWAITIFNSLVELRQRVEQGWGQVDIQLKRRHDLIPNLVNTVKGYSTHEASAQQALAAMRTQMTATALGQPGADVRSVQSQVQILKEAYPELKANENFLALQKSLSETEQRIALARSYFNSIATFFNTRLEVIPDRYIASLGGMKPRPLMAANDFERAPVEVSFAVPEKDPPPAPESQPKS